MDGVGRREAVRRKKGSEEEERRERSEREEVRREWVEWFTGGQGYDEQRAGPVVGGGRQAAGAVVLCWAGGLAGRRAGGLENGLKNGR